MKMKFVTLSKISNPKNEKKSFQIQIRYIIGMISFRKFHSRAANILKARKNRSTFFPVFTHVLEIWTWEDVHKLQVTQRALERRM